MESLLDLTTLIVVFWLSLGVVGATRSTSVRFVAHWLFPAGALGSLALMVIGWNALGAPAQTAVLPLGLPDLPMHLRLDSLSAAFVLLLGVAATGVSIFAAGYFREGEGTTPGLLCLQYHVFLACMVLVLLADDAFAFMVAWETMALSSYFLVTTQHRIAEIRRAGLLYLLIAHVGALAILLSFGVMQGGTWMFTFDAIRHAQLTPAWASAAFALALFGFGAKAGLLPLHVWLPEAHPAAPSPVSALMSGVMLKTAVYGMLRVSFDLLGTPLWWWGLGVLAIGLGSALFGVVFAAVQTDMKRLLAYSSIENIGVIFAGTGLAMIFCGFEQRALSALALTAAVLHAFNHACFKSLLFLVTGSVLHATHERNLGKLGGLIRHMPWVAWLGLIGVLAIAGLPPLNGFVSEWLLLQAFLFTPALPQTFVNMLVPLGAALLALCTALSAYVMVKFYGVVFLGQAREPELATAKDCGWRERIGLSWLTLCCVGIGLLPVPLLTALGSVSQQLMGEGFVNQGGNAGWLVPIAAQRASYGPVVFFAGMTLMVLLCFFIVRRLFHFRLRRAAPWDCGYPSLNPRMQDTAEGFGQPIRHLFEAFFRMRRRLPDPFDRAPSYEVQVEDRFWTALYQPIVALVDGSARQIGRLQQGRIAVYLLYSFLTLVGLLVLVL